MLILGVPPAIDGDDSRRPACSLLTTSRTVGSGSQIEMDPTERIIPASCRAEIHLHVIKSDALLFAFCHDDSNR